MNYFNYFEKIENKSDYAGQNKWILYFYIAVAIMCAGFYAFFFIGNMNLDYRIAFLDEIHNDPLINQKHETVIELFETVSNIDGEYMFVKKFENATEKIDTANLNLLKLLDEELVGLGHIKNIEVVGNKVKLVVLSKNLESNIKIQENLRSTDKFSYLIFDRTIKVFDVSGNIPVDKILENTHYHLLNEITLTLKEGAIQ